MPDRKPCVDCGKPKGPNRMLYCERCAAKHEHTPCIQCGTPMPRGRGRGKKLCDSCKPIRTPSGQVTPCLKCGSTEPKLFGRHVCDECAEVEREAALARRRSRHFREHKPCQICGKAKHRGRGARYCKSCAAALKAPRKCPRCERNPIVVPNAQMCELCRAEARERVKAKKREWSRAHPHRDHGKPRGSQKRDSAFEWRLKKERKGVVLEAVDVAPHDSFPRLPARPLAAAIALMVTREDRMLSLFDPCRRTKGSSMGGICARLGIEQRTYTGWRSGERILAEFDQVDTVLTRAGWLWWEVFNEETCRRPLFVAHVRELRSNGEKKPKSWQTVRRVCYGDWGTVRKVDPEPDEDPFEDGVDREALALVEQAFTGEGVDIADPVATPLAGLNVQGPPPGARTIEEYEAAMADRRRHAVAA